MTLPTFLVIGAAKSGTTTLHAGLEQHPDVFMSDPKEPNFFIADDPVLVSRSPIHPHASERHGYEELYAAGADHRARGEASTAYLLSTRAPRAVEQLIPDARLIVVLRDPVERAFSAWADLRQRGREPIADFMAAVEAEPERAARGGVPNLMHYVAAGQYATQLERWRAHFPPGQLQVHLTDDLAADPVAVLQRCYDHVGVAADVVPDVGVRFNRSGLPRSARAGRMIDGFGDSVAGRVARRVVPDHLRHRTRERFRAANLRPSPPLDDGIYERLAPRFADDLTRLRDVLGRDLTEWRSVRYLGRSA